MSQFFFNPSGLMTIIQICHIRIFTTVIIVNQVAQIMNQLLTLSHCSQTHHYSWQSCRQVCCTAERSLMVQLSIHQWYVWKKREGPGHQLTLQRGEVKHVHAPRENCVVLYILVCASIIPTYLTVFYPNVSNSKPLPKYLSWLSLVPGWTCVSRPIYWLGRAWASPTLVWLHLLKLCVCMYVCMYVCMSACGHIS